MKKLSDIIDAFFKGIARSRVSLIGAMITTIVFPFLLGLVIIDAAWHIDNPYLGAVIYMVLGPAFMLGLVMVFIGLFFLKGTEEVRLFTLDYLRDYFTDPSKFSKLRKLVFLAVFLTGVNLIIFGLLGYSGYHYMESNAFCGQFCHTVMNPEYTAYQNSPHSRVNCVECHIGAGATWFVKSKISGARQLFAVALNTYPRPIETPVHGLRPARETCEQCHRPDMFHGDKLYIEDKFLPDENNTHVQTVMLMRIGSAGSRTQAPHGIHWHAAAENRISYTHTDRERLNIPEVALSGPGEKVTFRSEELDRIPAEGGTRWMDCIDCHNRPTHIYLPPGKALDDKIMAGEIPREIPFIKRQALAAITQEFASREEALVAIDKQIRSWYETNRPDFARDNRQLLDRAVKGIQAAWAENVFPEMRIGWNTYINHIGHGENFDVGCFRCHGGMHEGNGRSISSDCNLCHIILAQDEADPAILRKLKGD